MSDYLKKIANQDRVNMALNVAQIAQTSAMNGKLEKLQQAQLETANIQKQIVEINTQTLLEQKRLAELGSKQLKEQTKQTKALEIQNNLSRFKIEQDIQEREKEKASKERFSNMMEVVFYAPKELEVINNSDNHKIEKFFMLQSLKTNCLSAGVSTEGVDDFESKKHISEFLENITNSIDHCLELNPEEEKDLQEIFDILSVDEEEEIKKEKKELKVINAESLQIKREIKEKEELIKKNGATIKLLTSGLSGTGKTTLKV